ncbi:ATG16 domain containing protein [Ceratobasidium theobromae]|uniref:ATG16 domain containing protein n=1 Tax=Ceratobasidium theobromae TaxID=1582974 RepID=A0A5N5QDG7_9AGAM|nr:ATG16 domain containing protein [Ceratobasidium theobromae]
MSCVVGLQSQEIPRLSFYATAYNELLGRFRELEQIHNQRMSEYKAASDTINLLKARLVTFAKAQPPAAPTVTSPSTSAQPLASPQNAPSMSTSTGKPPPVIDWNSESGKFFSNYLLKQRETLLAAQKECDALKGRVAELTTQLEAKSKLDPETVTAIEKAELMEAELEGLHERLEKCEEDLKNSQAELAKTKAQNEELTSQVSDFKEKAVQTRNTLSKAQLHLVTLQNRCTTAERDLATARESLKAKDEALKANARSPKQQPADLSRASGSSGERTIVYVPTAAELEQATSMLASLQNEVSRLTREKIGINQEIIRLKGIIKEKETENQVLGEKLLKSAELASELGRYASHANRLDLAERAPELRMHLAANSRSQAAEEKLSAAEKQVQELKQRVSTQQKELSDMQKVVNITSGITKLAEYQAQVSKLESDLENVTRARDEALVQLDSWEQNRNSWKRWGEIMALRAKQWEDEALKARSQLEEPPVLPLPDVSASGGGPLTEPGKTRKRPLDMPDTDVDGPCVAAQPSAPPTTTPSSTAPYTSFDKPAAGPDSSNLDRDEPSERKKARLEVPAT